MFTDGDAGRDDTHTHTHTHAHTPVDTKPGMNTHLSCQFSLYRSSELFCP